MKIGVMVICDVFLSVEDLILCFICYEKFKLFWLLLCFYFFCYKCLCVYIVISCEDKDVFLGFFCFFCWEFILLLG